MRNSMVTMVMACLLLTLSAGCGGDDGGGACAELAAEQAGADADDLAANCTAACERVIGCTDRSVDADGNWICEPEPGCRPGLTPQQAFQEYFQCDGYCLEIAAAGRGVGNCLGNAAALVDCFDALACETFRDAPPNDVIDRECASSQCLVDDDCY